MYKKLCVVKSYFLNIFTHNKADKNKLFMTVVSLVLVLIILITVGTLCWYSIISPTVESDIFEFDAGKGLRVNDSGVDAFKSEINDSYLIPASSVDGRNIFFPTDGSDFSDVTNKITYRSADAGDKNFSYIQIDFKLTAQTNNTAIYIDTDKTSLTVKESVNNFTAQAAAPLRMAIFCNNPVTNNGAPAVPVVFNSQAKTVHTAAVSEVDRGSGEYISNGPQVAHQFLDYAVGGKPVTTLKAGKETLFSVIIWLEGCDPKCTYDKVNKNDIRLRLAFKTSWDDTEVIRFKDDSGYCEVPLLGSEDNPRELGLYELKSENNYSASTDITVHSGKTYYCRNWVSYLINKCHYKLNLRFTKSTDSTETSAFNMYKYIGGNDEWFASIPSDMKNMIEFVLSPGAESTGTTTYTFCKSDGYDGREAGVDNTYDRGVNRQYVVQASVSETVSECMGHWVALGDSDGGGLDIGDLDGDDF